MFEPGSGRATLGALFTLASVLANAYLLLDRSQPASATATCAAGAPMACTGEGVAQRCTCDGRPLGAGQAGALVQFYPYGNKSLASIYDTQAFLKDALVPLSKFRAKAILIGNTASN